MSASAGDTMTKEMKMIKLNDRLLEQLECPVCLDTCKPPIYMCVNGHNTCSECKLKIVECPVCRTPGSPTIRNIAVEAISAEILFPCHLKKSGCPTMTRLQDLQNHQLNCDYRHKCELCEWAGDVLGLNSHLMQTHKRYYTNGNDFEGNWKLDFNKSSKIFKYLYWDGELFLCALTYLTNKETLYLQCHCVGDETTARMYKAMFLLASESGDLICSYSKTCSASDEVADQPKAVPLHKDLLDILVHKDGKLNCKFRLQRLMKYAKQS